MVKERLFACDVGDEYDKLSQEMVERLEDFSDTWGDIDARLEMCLYPGRVSLITLVGIDKSPEDILVSLREDVISEERKVVILDVKDYVSLDKDKCPNFWRWLLSETFDFSKENEDSIIIVKGFENCHAEYDDLMPSVIQSVDVYGDYSFNRSSVVLLPDLAFMLFANLYTRLYYKKDENGHASGKMLSNWAGFRDRGMIHYIRTGSEGT